MTYTSAVFVERVGVFLEHVDRTLKASELLTPNFPVVSLHFACLLALVASNTTAATLHLESESITGQPVSKSVVMTKLLGSSRTDVVFFFFYIKNESVREKNSRTVSANNVHEDCWYSKNRLQTADEVETHTHNVAGVSCRLT